MKRLIRLPNFSIRDSTNSFILMARSGNWSRKNTKVDCKLSKNSAYNALRHDRNRSLVRGDHPYANEEEKKPSRPKPAKGHNRGLVHPVALGLFGAKKSLPCTYWQSALMLNQTTTFDRQKPIPCQITLRFQMSRAYS